MKRRLIFIFTTAMILLLSASIIAGRSFMQLKTGIKLREDAFELQSKLDEVFESLEEADVAFLIFRLAPNKENYDDFMFQMEESKKIMHDLISISRKNQFIGQDLLKLQKAVLEKFNVTHTTIVEHNFFYGRSVKKIITIKNDLLLTKSIRDFIEHVNQINLSEIKKRQNFVDKHFWMVMFVLIFDFVISFLLLISFAILVLMEIKRRNLLEKDLRSAQEAAIAASNLKSQFLATVGHEIRTPLNGIIGMSDLVKNRVHTAELKKFTEIIYQSSRNLLRIVNDILDFSKIESNKINFEIQEISIGKIIENAITLFSKRAVEKNINLSSSFPKDLLDLYLGDGDRISQVLHNLLSNAIKFTEKGKVEVIAEIIGKQSLKHTIKIQVIDSGMGIDRASKKILFKPFTQLENAKHKEGTGLGLAICKRLVEYMDGQIDFESTPGQGTRFWFTIRLPFKRKAETSSELESALPPTSKVSPASKKLEADYTLDATAILDTTTTLDKGGDQGQVIPMPEKKNESGPLILLVEDNETNQLLAKAHLESYGYRVQVVNNGQECLSAIRDSNRKYDLILMDCRMPIMDGFEATRAIRIKEKEQGLARAQFMPIVAMTANAMSGDKEKCLAAGMDDYISKPFEMSHLHSIIQKLIRVSDDGKTEEKIECGKGGSNEGNSKTEEGGSKTEEKVEVARINAITNSTVIESSLGQIDWEIIKALELKTNTMVIKRLIDSIKQTLEISIQKLKAAFENQEWATIVNISHQLKSSSAALGAINFSNECQQIERNIQEEGKIEKEAFDYFIEGATLVLKEFKDQQVY